MKNLLVLLFMAATANCLSVSVKDEGKKMVCYYGSWAVYRPGQGMFDVENIDPFLCTHIIYGFAGLGSDDTIISLDPYNDLYEDYGLGAFLRFTKLKKKNPALKAMIAIGGWNEGSTKYSKMVSDPVKRAKFTKSVVDFLNKYHFDGLDFDWEYPANRGGSKKDKENFISMISELKEAFAPKGYILSAAVSAGKATIDTAYDIPSMNKILDQVHLMCYDYHGDWESFTGHNAPLYLNPTIDTGDNVYFNTNFSVNYWLDNGMSASKIVLGMPLYGHGFVLRNPDNHGFYDDATSACPPGPYTEEPGTWGYNEICEKFQNEHDWVVNRDPYYMAPYAYKGNLWLGYDDQESLIAKAQYVNSMALAGSMVWSIETDDFHGSCHGKPFIMIHSIVDTMNGGSTPIIPTIPPITPTTKPTTSSGPTTTADPFRTTPSLQPDPICKDSGLMPDPNDCSIYYDCLKNADGSWTMFKYHCADGTVFSPDLHICTWPDLVPGCAKCVANIECHWRLKRSQYTNIKCNVVFQGRDNFSDILALTMDS